VRSIVWLRSGIGIVALLWAEAAHSQVSADYSGQLSAQLAALDIGPVTLPPWPLAPFSFPPSPNAIGREWGQAAAAPTYRIGDSAFGLQLDVYSNENTAYAGRRGAVAFDEANLNLTRIKPATPLSFEELALFYAGSFGRLEIGYGPGVSERTAVTGPHDYGVGSFAGDFPYFLQNPQDVGFDTISAYGSANTSPRLLYMSPRVYGLQLGATYQPDTRDTGVDFTYGEKSLGIIGREPTATGTYEAVSAGFINVVEGGLNYDATFGGVRIQASLAGIRGDAAPSPTGAPFHGLTSYQTGFQLGYGDWSIGGGAVTAGTSGYTEAATVRQRQEQYDFEGGIQYAPGRWTFGAGALYSSDEGDPTFRSNRQLYFYSAGLRYQFTRDLDAGVELDKVKTESADFGDYTTYMAIIQLRYAFAGSYSGSR
jgi:hypothetical protein